MGSKKFVPSGRVTGTQVDKPGRSSVIPNKGSISLSPAKILLRCKEPHQLEVTIGAEQDESEQKVTKNIQMKGRITKVKRKGIGAGPTRLWFLEAKV